MGDKFCTFSSLLHRGTVIMLFNTFEERIYGTKLHQRRSRKTPLVRVALEACGGRHLEESRGPLKKGAVMKIDQVEWDNEGPQLTRG